MSFVNRKRFQVVQLRLPNSLCERIRKAVKDENRDCSPSKSRNAWIIKAIEEKLESRYE